jgi:aldehyde:ferredoxin oxidoreductase
MNKLKGFTGKILEVDLSSKAIKTIPLDEKLAENVLGGAGYAYGALFPLLNKNTDPLGPENIMFFMGGPLLGSSGTCTGRIVVCAKSPITGLLGESNCGSFIAPEIKKAGWDGIIIKGASKTPVYIEIADDKVEIKDASAIWGKNVYETHEILKAPENWKRAKVMCIGKAGENLVKFATIASEERAFGRTGMGCVMGSKKLKAIIVKGTKKIELAKPDEFREAAKSANENMMQIFTMQMMGSLGTSGGLSMYAVTGELPVKYWRSSVFEDPSTIDGGHIQEKYLKRQRFCFSCPVGCGRIITVDDAKEQGLPEGEFAGPEYETIAGFGSIMLNTDMKAIIKANYICNDYGLDTITTSNTIALLMDCIDRGKITSKDIDGINLKWGAMPSVYKLIEKIGLKEGIGKVLSEGSNAVGRHFKINQDDIATVKNSEIPYHDLRSSNGMSVAYAISDNYGAMHCHNDMYMVSTGAAVDELEIQSINGQENSVEIAISAAKNMEYKSFYSSVIVCVFGVPHPSEIAKMLETGMGIPFDVNRVKETGERILTLKRLFNLKMGHKPSDEKLPKILVTPLTEGGTNGNVPDTKLLFSEVYKYEEWDPVTGMPSKSKIERLGLQAYSKW